MGDEPLRLDIEGWSLEVAIKSYGAQLAIITDERPPATHYVRITSEQTYQLFDYLERNLPLARQKLISA